MKKDKHTDNITKLEQVLVESFKLKFKANVIEELKHFDKVFYTKTDFKIKLEMAKTLIDCVSMTRTFLEELRRTITWNEYMTIIKDIDCILEKIFYHFKMLYSKKEVDFYDREINRRDFIKINDDFYKLLIEHVEGFHEEKLRKLQNSELNENADENKPYVKRIYDLNEHKKRIIDFQASFARFKEELIQQGYENYKRILFSKNPHVEYFLIDSSETSSEEIHELLLSYFSRKDGQYYQGLPLVIAGVDIPYYHIHTFLEEIMNEPTLESTIKALAYFYSSTTKHISEENAYNEFNEGHEQREKNKNLNREPYKTQLFNELTKRIVNLSAA